MQSLVSNYSNNNLSDHIKHASSPRTSLFHELLLNGSINIEEFQAGLAFLKLYKLNLRSRGVKNTFKTSSQNWEKINGITHDNFSSFKIESLWKKILIILNRNPFCRDAKQILIIIASAPHDHPIYPTKKIKNILFFLNSIWKECSNTPYKRHVRQLFDMPIIIKNE